MKFLKSLFLVFLAASGVAQAIPAFVKSTTIQGYTASPASVTFTPNTAGDSVLVGVMASGTGTFGTPTNSLSTAIQDVTTAHFEYIRVASSIASAQTFSIPYSGFTEIYVVVLEVTPGVILDQAVAENSGSSVSPVTNSLSPASNNEFFLTLIKTGSGAVTFSAWTNSFTQDRQSVGGPSMADAYLVQTTGPTSISSGVTISPTEAWVSMLAAYEVGGSAKPAFVISNGHVLMSNGKPVVIQ
jgi:hypothetical protein